jgi:hypothetical protein
MRARCQAPLIPNGLPAIFDGSATRILQQIRSLRVFVCRTGQFKGVWSGLITWMGGRKGNRSISNASSQAGSTRREIPILLTERQLRQTGQRTDGAPLEVQILGLAEEHQALIIGQRRTKTSPSLLRRRGNEVIQRSSERYDSMILDGCAKAFGGNASGAGA